MACEDEGHDQDECSGLDGDVNNDGTIDILML